MLLYVGTDGHVCTEGVEIVGGDYVWRWWLEIAIGSGVLRLRSEFAIGYGG